MPTKEDCAKWQEELEQLQKRQKELRILIDEAGADSLALEREQATNQDRIVQLEDWHRGC